MPREASPSRWGNGREWGSRDDGPAYEWDDGSKAWIDEDGNFHREDGPALESANGHRGWYAHGRCIFARRWWGGQA